MNHFDSPTIEISLPRIVANYQLLKQRFNGQECAATIKANAYGLGAETVARALAKAGCHSFFVATLAEAIALRQSQPHARIAVFHGCGAGEELAFINHRLIPVLNSLPQLIRWIEVAQHQKELPSILHLDTGMARLGLTPEVFANVDEAMIEKAQIALLMSHLACASEPDHPQNEQQLDLFISLTSRFPHLPTSLPNSAGILLGEAWHDDLARPGCGLYGIEPIGHDNSGILPVVRLSAPILQRRELDRQQSIGYGATQILPKGARVATVAIGYADGVFRHLTGQLHGCVQGHKVPLVGRVTMDMCCFDVSAVPEAESAEGMRVVLMDERQTVNDLAQQAGTIGYEVLTSLGPRVRRVYHDWT